MQQLASKAYGQVEKRTASEKQIELALFQQITQALVDIDRQEKPAPTEWADAIHRNLQLWTTLTVDLAQPDNALPDELKRSLIYISEFVRRHSQQVLAGDAELGDLIEINQNIMGGLAGQPVAESV